MGSTPPSSGRRATDFPVWAPQPQAVLDPSEVRAAGLYADEDDQLVVVVYNAAAGVTLEVRLRTVMLDGRIVPQTYVVTPTSARLRFAQVFDVSQSFILGCSVQLTGGTARRGQTFVQVSLGRGPAAAPVILHTLVSEYVCTDQAPVWPGGLIRQSTEGPGLIRSITGTDQAAGVEISETVPTGARWRLRGFRAALVTSATVANRRVHLFADDGVTRLWELAAADIQAASLTRNYNATPDGFARATQDNEVYVPLPYDVVLLAGSRIRTVTTLLDAGDNWGAPQLHVEEWIEV